MKIIILSIAMLLTKNVFSQNKEIWNKQDSTWNWVLQGSDGTIYLMKKTYETKEDDETTIWIKIFTPVVKVKGKITKQPTIQKTLMVFDCNSKKVKAIQVSTYTMEEKLIKSVTIESYAQKWTYVVPETISETLLKKACEL